MLAFALIAVCKCCKIYTEKVHLSSGKAAVEEFVKFDCICVELPEGLFEILNDGFIRYGGEIYESEDNTQRRAALV